ncbi:hypothetical protein [Streptomyces luteireticuli]|uniref:hypothetical protein n=1 Tax=Streptomyces luteireticuli TaxID=173858 RepID=UPI003557EA7C
MAAWIVYPVTLTLAPPQHLQDIPVRRRAQGVLVSWPAEGLAFWPALARHF